MVINWSWRVNFRVLFGSLQAVHVVTICLGSSLSEHSVLTDFLWCRNLKRPRQHQCRPLNDPYKNHDHFHTLLGFQISGSTYVLPNNSIKVLEGLILMFNKLLSLFVNLPYIWYNVVLSRPTLFRVLVK